MAQDKIVYPPLSEDLQGGQKWRALKYFGAGAIMASVTIGSGETLFASRSGAVFGYALLYSFGLQARPEGIAHVFRRGPAGTADYVGLVQIDDWPGLAGLAQ